MADLTGIDPARVRELEDVENARFVAERPRSMALQEQARRSMPRGVPMAWMDDLYEHPPVWVSHGDGASFTDVDGHTYLDMYVADMSAFCGHAARPVIDAVDRSDEAGQPVSAARRGRRLPSPSTSPLATGCRNGSSRSRPPRRTPR